MAADASVASLYYHKDTTFPSSVAFPSGNPTLATARITGETLGQDTESAESEEIRSGGNRSFVARVGLSASGEVSMELRTDQDVRDHLQAALLSAAWTSALSDVDTVYSMVNATNTLNRSSGSFITDGFAVGDWIKISGFTDPANNGWFRISVLTATDATLQGSTVNDEAAGDSVTVKRPAYIQNGTTLSYLHYERVMADVASEFPQIVGNLPETMGLSVAAKALIGLTFGMMGKGEVTPTPTSTGGDGSPTAAGTREPMQTVDNVKLFMADADTTLDVSDWTMNTNNNLRTRDAIGTLGAVSIGRGEFSVDGSLTVYYETKALYDKYTAFSTVPLALRCEDNVQGSETTGAVLIFDLPETKVTNGRRVAGGKNTDIMGAFDFQAFGKTYGYTMRVYYEPAA